MNLPALKIQHRIAVPFTLLFGMAILATALVSQSLISSTLEQQLQDQVERASEVLALSDFALNVPILQQVKQIVDADIVTYTRDGQVLATTLDDANDNTLLNLIRSTEAAEVVLLPRAELLMRSFVHDSAPYTVAYRPLPGSSDTVIAFAVETGDIAAARTAISQTLALIGLVIIGLMALTSQFIARGIAAPIGQLATFTKSIASGERTTRTPVKGSEEVGRLAESFNEMVEKLREYEDKLLQSEKLAVTGLLAAQVAHEIRNPLLSMKMEAQLLQTKLEAGTTDRDLIDAVIREIDRVEWVVKGMLELARPGKLRLSPTDVNHCLREVLDQTALQLRHRQIEVERHFQDDLPETLLDIDRLKQGLLNIVLNAADAMTKGGRLTVTTSVVEGGNSIIVGIIDDGEGLDPDIRDRLFEPFVSTKRDGVGLGLVNARSVVERHSGRISLKPGPEGVGTRVTIELPIVSATPDDEPAGKNQARERIHG